MGSVPEDAANDAIRDAMIADGEMYEAEAAALAESDKSVYPRT